MYVKRLYLAAFRRFEELDLIFKQGLTILEGPNGRGKTTVLEALYLLASGSSFRAHSLKDLLQAGSNAFFIETEYLKDQVESSVSLGFDGEKRRVALSGHVQEKASSLFGNLLAVISTPDDLELIFGSPQIRRRELDIINAQYIPGFAPLLSRYDRILQQRNKLLKQKLFDTIAVWEEELAEVGAVVMRQRQILLEEIKIRFQEELSAFLEGDASMWSLDYQATVSEASSEKLLSAYRDRREQEVRAGHSLFGPHRDDIQFRYEGVLAKSRVSLGQAKLALFAFRLASWSLLKDRSGEEPLFLIDDMESFLDLGKRRAVVKRVEKMEQVIASLFSASACNSNCSTHTF